MTIEKQITFAQQLRVVGDSARLDIMCLLISSKKVCVSDIAEKLQMSIATTSHHLQVLSREGLLIPEREGKKICYSLSKDPVVTDLKRLICKYK